MSKKIHLISLKKLFIKYKLIFFVFSISLCIMVLFILLNMYVYPWGALLFSFAVIPIIIWNFFLNPDFSLLNTKFIRIIELGYIEAIFFVLVSAIILTVLFLLVFHRNKKIKNWTVGILLLIYLAVIITEFIPTLPPYLAYSGEITVCCADSLMPFLRMIPIAITFIYLLNSISEESSWKNLARNIIRYIFLILEIALALYVGQIFLNWKVVNEGTGSGIVLMKIIFVILGFIIFVILENLRGYFLNILQKRHNSKEK